MTAGRLLLPFALALVPAVLVAAPPPETLTVVLRCDACTATEKPSIGLLWRGVAAAEPPLASVETLDWDAGSFAWHAPGAGAAAVQGNRLEDGSGWTVSVPLPAGARPFRLVAALQGFAADRSAWWPEREAGPYVVTMRPVAEVLDANPAWDPQRTPECDVLVPAAAETPVTFYVEGQPRAWLYPAANAADGTAQWTFQFVRPGQSLLERVSVLVPAFADGDAWAFRLPLHALLAGGATWPAQEGGVRSASAEPADEIRIGGVGTFRLADCPRATR